MYSFSHYMVYNFVIISFFESKVLRIATKCSLYTLKKLHLIMNILRSSLDSFGSLLHIMYCLKVPDLALA